MSFIDSLARDKLARHFADMGIQAFLDTLGLKYLRRGRRYLVSCWYHADDNPSMVLDLGPQGTIRGHCWPCNRTVDCHHIAGHALGYEPERRFVDLLRRECEVFGRSDLITAPSLGARSNPQSLASKGRVEPEPVAHAYDYDSVYSMLRRPDESQDVTNWCKSRGWWDALVDPTVQEIVLRDLFRAYVPSLYPATDYDGTFPDHAKATPDWLKPWANTHQAIFPCFDWRGRIAGLRARCTVVGAKLPKVLLPPGASTAGMVLANDIGQYALEHGVAPDWADTSQIWIVEGEPSFIDFCLSEVRGLDTPRVAIYGVCAMNAWGANIARRVSKAFPEGTPILVRTHADEGGLRHFEHVYGVSNGLNPVYHSAVPNKAVPQRKAG